jgi:hypothetical protein
MILPLLLGSLFGGLNGNPHAWLNWKQLGALPAALPIDFVACILEASRDAYKDEIAEPSDEGEDSGIDGEEEEDDTWLEGALWECAFAHRLVDESEADCADEACAQHCGADNGPTRLNNDCHPQGRALAPELAVLRDEVSSLFETIRALEGEEARFAREVASLASDDDDDPQWTDATDVVASDCGLLLALLLSWRLARTRDRAGRGFSAACQTAPPHLGHTHHWASAYDAPHV